jgi:dTMP kinase
MEEQRRKDDEKRRAEEQEAESRKKQEQGVREREIAAKIIKARLHAISWKKLLNRFRKWTQVTLNRRDMEAFVKQQNALEKVKQLEEASKAAASESELKERELLERLEREKEELARRDEELDAAHSKEKEEDARRYAALMAQEAAKVAEETRKRVEEEQRREEAQAKALAEASRKEMNVQTSIDFDALASNDAADEERRATQRAAEQSLLELGLESGVAVTQDELMKRAQSRVEANKQAHMPSKMDLKEGLEREMRARLEKKKGQGTSAK